MIQHLYRIGKEGVCELTIEINIHINIFPLKDFIRLNISIEISGFLSSPLQDFLIEVSP